MKDTAVRVFKLDPQNPAADLEKQIDALLKQGSTYEVAAAYTTPGGEVVVIFQRDAPATPLP